MKDYWQKRYLKGGKIWGIAPSKSVEHALGLFQERNAKRILVPGAGYGRNSKLFSGNNFDVVGIEISDDACIIAKNHDPDTKFIVGNVLDMPFDNESYDAIYCYNVLHLFLQDERNLFLKKCYSKLNADGLVYFVVFSEKEKSHGKGKEIETNTYESKPGRSIHYFSEEDLINHFKDFSVIQTGIMEDKEDHGEIGAHVHVLRYIFAKKNIR
jgi:SAM-dependent methyltransferase